MVSITHPSEHGPADPHPFPAPAQVALALAVLKSKPAEKNVEEYLSFLQKHAVHGEVPVRNAASLHLDGAAYWKQAYYQAEEEKAALQDKLFKLEKHKSAVTWSSSPSTRSPLTNDGKRRRETTPAAKANSRSKRRKQYWKMPVSPEINAVSQTTDELYGPTSLLRAFFALRVQLNGQSPDHVAIASSAIRLSRTISTSITATRKEAVLEMDCDDGGAELYLATQKMYLSIFEAIELLHNKSGIRCAMTLISELAKAFTEMLRFLDVAATQEQHTWRSLPSSRNPEDGTSQTSRLANLIACLMTDLNLDKESHRGTFEALASTFFEHLGARLSLTVFTALEPLGQSWSSGILPPRGFLAEQSAEKQIDQTEILKASPYLVAILRKVMMFAEGKIGQLDLFSNTHKTGTDHGVAATIRETLQNTLLRGLFGYQEEAFQDSLRRPPEVNHGDDIDRTMAYSENENTSEWFIGQVWEYVGWDILTKQIQ